MREWANHPWRTVGALVATFALAAAAMAQPAGTPPAPPPTGPTTGQPGVATQPGAPAQPAMPGQPGGAAMTQNWADVPLAIWVAIGNHGEVVLGQFAEQHTQNQQVREFAQMMVREHTDFDNRLRQAVMGQGGATPVASRTGPGGTQGPAGQSGAGTPNQNGAADQNQGAAGQNESRATGNAGGAAPVPGSGTAGNTPGAGSQFAGSPGAPGTVGAAGAPGVVGPMGIDFLRLKDQIGQQEVSLTQKELGRHQGADFDKAYMNQQLVAHTDMLATLQTIRNYASGNFRTTVDQGIQATQQHLERAHQILQQLEGQKPAATAQRPAGEQH